MNGDNFGQNGDNERLDLHGLKMWLRNLYVAYECVVFVTLTNNAELFFNAFPIESHFILFLDSLQCVARMNCLVLHNFRTFVTSTVVRILPSPNCKIYHQ